ncbi:MAG TPA: hypothetical protein VH833_04320 [Gemmatimonadales bacterium]|jgi:hypothetical protein
MLEQGAVQIAEVMVPQVPDRQPQVLFRDGAEDLGRGPLVFGLLRPKQNPAAPYPILGASYREANDDTLSFKSYGGKVVDDGFAYGWD